MQAKTLLFIHSLFTSHEQHSMCFEKFFFRMKTPQSKTLHLHLLPYKQPLFSLFHNQQSSTLSED